MWAIAGWTCWRFRAGDRMLPMLALMSVVLLLGNVFMLYSRAPHDTQAMIAHLGKVGGRLVVLISLMQMASRDMRELIHAEQKFRALLESAPDAMVIVGRGGNIALINSQTEKLFGYPREGLIGQPIEILVPPRFRDKHPGYRSGFFASPKVRSIGAG